MKIQYWVRKKLTQQTLSQSPGFVLMGALGGTMVICLMNYCYADLQMIVRHSLNIWELLLQNRILEFYRVGSMSPIGNSYSLCGEVPYDFWVYLPIAVWNLPIFIWEKLQGLTFETNYLALLWVRVGAMLPFAGSNWAIWKIVDLWRKDKLSKMWACYLFSSSMFLLNGLFCIGQIDIMNVFFMLLGMEAYLRKDKRKFIFWFIFSITCKMFSLFVFIPLLLLAEKKILYIIRDVLAAASLSLLSKMIFFFDKMATPTKFDEGRFSQFLFDRKINLSGVTLPAFVITFLFLMVWCWYTKYDEDNLAYIAVWAAYAGYACFFVGATTYPYWSVVFSPFLSLLVVLYPRKAKTLLWLETIAGVSYFLYGLYYFGWIYSGKSNIRWMLCGILNDRNVESIALFDAMQRLPRNVSGNLEALFFSALFVSVISTLVLTWPNKKKSNETGYIAVDYGSVVARQTINSVIVLMPLIYYLLLILTNHVGSFEV